MQRTASPSCLFGHLLVDRMRVRERPRSADLVRARRSPQSHLTRRAAPVGRGTSLQVVPAANRRREPVAAEISSPARPRARACYHLRRVTGSNLYASLSSLLAAAVAAAIGISVYLRDRSRVQFSRFFAFVSACASSTWRASSPVCRACRARSGSQIR